MYEIKDILYTNEESEFIYLKYRDSLDPLLEYVYKWSEEFCPSYEGRWVKDPVTGQEKEVWIKVYPKVPAHFIVRLLKKCVNDVELCKTRYTSEANELLAMLDAFDIDKDKFWYFCLMLKDYIEGYAEGRKPLPSHSKVLKEMIEKLDEMEPDENIEKWSSGVAKHNATLTLKVEGNRKAFTTEDTTVLNVINYALTHFYHDYCVNENSTFHSCSLSSEKARISNTDKAFLFNEYMKWFLKDKEIRHATEGSKSKDLLISRALYVFGIIPGSKKRFYDYDGMGNRFLRDMIRGCSDPRKKSINEYYHGL